MKKLDKAILAFVKSIEKVPENFVENFADYPHLILCHGKVCTDCTLSNFDCHEARQDLSAEAKSYLEAKYPEILL
jgi:hypothetical protein